MMSLSQPQRVALLIPFLLIPSTALVFEGLSQSLGPELGYVLGFLFYWIAWCILVPIFLLGAGSVVSSFSEENPLFQRSNVLPAILLIVIVVATVIMYPPSLLLAAPIRLLIISIPVAIVNGVCEEVLWRGVYMRMFPLNFTLGVIYPSVGFALWHISPQLVLPAESGVWPFVISTFFLGIGYGWIASRTRSVRWPAIAHSLGGILSLGGFIAPSIVSLLVQ
jgi:membrane protease YdiL (CAAX protease family)